MTISPEALAALDAEMDWLQQVLDQALRSYLLQEGHEQDWRELPRPDTTGDAPYHVALRRWQPDVAGRLALALALAPQHRPEVLDVFFGKNGQYDRAFTEFGGLPDRTHAGFLPTGQTLAFVLRCGDPSGIAALWRWLGADSILVREGVLQLEQAGEGLPLLAGALTLPNGWYQHFLSGEPPVEAFGAAFPAKAITTMLDWSDLVLEEPVLEQVQEILIWIRHGAELMNDRGLAGRIRPGYRALFYGPPGTGKTLTAALLGKASGLDVYRVDLSQVVSKYIGETEKTIGRIFNTARVHNWILYFDAADALFGKRTIAPDSEERFANQQTGYLLQQMEDYPGVVLLASKVRGNMDEAFTRRFQSVIHFPMPAPAERLRLLQQAFAGVCTLHPSIDLAAIAGQYELSGGAIINVLRSTALAAVAGGRKEVENADLLRAIGKEIDKDHKAIS